MKMMLTTGLLLGLIGSAQAMGYTCSNQEGTKVNVSYYRITLVKVTKGEVETSYFLNTEDKLFLSNDYSEAVGTFKIDQIVKPIDFKKCGRTRLGCPEFPKTYYYGTLTLDNQTETLSCSPY